MTTPPSSPAPLDPLFSGAPPHQEAPVPSAASVAALLDRLASPGRLAGLRDAKDRSLIMAAIEEDDPEMVAFLAPRSDLMETLKVNSGRDARYYSPLMLAAHLGRTACVTALLQHRPQEQCTPNSFSPVDLAVEAGHLDCVTLLAPWSDLKNRRRLNPMIRAASMGRLDLVKALLPYVHLNARDDYERNALGAAVSVTTRSPEQDACVQFLLQQPGIEVRLPGEDAYNRPTDKVLFDAILHHQVNAVRWLLPYFDVNALRHNGSGRNWDGTCTALHMAIAARDADCVALLLPLSDQALHHRQTLPSNQSRNENNTTPVEFALAKLENCGTLHDWYATVAVADVVLAFCVRQGLPVPMPRFETLHTKRPLTDVEQREHWPQLFNALESEELRKTLNADQPDAPAPASRHRL